MLYLYLYGGILRVYLFVWIGLIYDVIRRGKGERGLPIKAEPISAAGQGGGEGVIDGNKLLLVVLLLYFMIYVLAVLKHALG